MRLLTCIATLLAALGAAGAVLAQSAAPTAPPTIAFTHVHVVPMDRERVLRDQTVLVQGDKIAAIGRTLRVPAGARVIDAKGAYLAPGLADMHTHANTRDDLTVYLAHGVTTLLHMGEASNALIGRTRAAANAGTIPAPHLYAALAVDGSPRYGHLVVTNAEEARATITVARANGYDFIKAYTNLSAEAFTTLAQEGRRQGIPVVGHSVVAMRGIEPQLAAGQVMVAHLEEFLYAYFFPPDMDSGQTVPLLDAIPGAVAMLRKYGAFVTADPVTYATIAAQWGKPGQVQAYLHAPEVRLLSPRDRLDWPRAGYDAKTGSLQPRAAFLGRFAKALADGGVPIIAGTDAPTIPGLFPGDALHRNLALLQTAGLSRYQVLATATRTAGDFIAKTRPGGMPFGTVTAGSRADLILTRANPLDDLVTLRSPIGVMSHGQWHDAAELKTLTEAIAQRYADAVR